MSTHYGDNKSLKCIHGDDASRTFNWSDTPRYLQGGPERGAQVPQSSEAMATRMGVWPSAYVALKRC